MLSRPPPTRPPSSQNGLPKSQQAASRHGCHGRQVDARLGHGGGQIDPRQQWPEQAELPRCDQTHRQPPPGADEVHPADEHQYRQEPAGQQMKIGETAGTNQGGRYRGKRQHHRQRGDDQLPDPMLRTLRPQQCHDRTDRQGSHHHACRGHHRRTLASTLLAEGVRGNRECRRDRPPGRRYRRRAPREPCSTARQPCHQDRQPASDRGHFPGRRQRQQGDRPDGEHEAASEEQGFAGRTEPTGRSCTDCHDFPSGTPAACKSRSVGPMQYLKVCRGRLPFP